MFGKRQQAAASITVIAAGSVVEGTLRARGLVQVDGTIDGALIADGHVSVGPEGKILGEVTAEQLSVPTLSVQWDRRGSYVWKVVDGAARRAEIDILRRESGVVIVQGDLQAGEKIVVEGIQRLREGARVAEVNVEPAMVEEAPPPGRGEPAVSGGEPARTRS